MQQSRRRHASLSPTEGNALVEKGVTVGADDSPRRITRD